MPDVDWSQMLIPSTSVVEIMLRGTIIYLVLFFTMRFLPRREIGGMGPADLLVVVLIADAVQNGMSDSYESVTEAIVLAGTIFFWATVIDWLDFRFPHWHIAQARPLPLIRQGELLRANMARQHITEEELMSQLRAHGLESPRNVVAAFLEGDGAVSVLVRGKTERARKPPGHETGAH